MTKNPKMWKRTVYKIGLWLTAEIWLNLIGLDNFADYSEFIFTQESFLNLKNRRTVKINRYPPRFCPEINHFCPLPGTVVKSADLPRNTNQAQTEIFKNKCRQLTKPCIKIVYLNFLDSNLFIN